MKFPQILRAGAVFLGLTVVSCGLARPSKPDVVLKNDRLSLGFDGGTLSLVSLVDPLTGHEFLENLPESSSLWVLDMEKPDGTKFQVRSSGDGKRRLKRSGDTVTLTWSGVAAGDEPGALEVVVTVSLAEGADRSFWNIEVRNESQACLVNVLFPFIEGISKPGQPSAAVPRHNWGNLEREITYIRGSYPCDIWPMQFLALLEKNTGLYLAYEDPKTTPKYFDLRPGKHFFFTSFVENSTQPGNDFISPGPVAIGVCGPDWWRAAKMYRKWATQQQWARRGPLTKPSDIPEGAKNIGIWFNEDFLNVRAEEKDGQFREAEEFYQLPLAAQIYFWHRAAFDTEYPEYFPARPGFESLVRNLVGRGAFVAPYVNGRLQDLNVPSAEAARPFLVKKRDGTSPVEDYQSGATLGAMCPATAYWQKTMLDVSRRLVEEGVNAIYYDQIAAAEPYLCFDPSHGHPLGGGSYWVEGYRKMLGEVKKLRTAAGEPVLIASENTAESYMDVVDAFLTWTPRDPTEIPLLTAVYSGYAIYFGSNAQVEENSGLGPFAMIVGRDMLWGTQPGWMHIDLSSGRGGYLRDVARVRYAARRFFQFGELVGELKPTADPGTTTGGWKNVKRDGSGATPVTLPAVMSAVWKSPDGALGLAVANLSGEERSFSYRVRPSDYGVNLPEGGRWKLVLTNVDGDTELPATSQDDLEREERLKPWEFRVVSVLPEFAVSAKP
jgi:hypothetical protein